MTGSGWSANYYLFGEVASQTGSGVDTRFDFTGQERDAGTGLMYFGARYYDPEIGRWLVVDPMADSLPSLTPYHYVRNNPINRVDLDGRQDEEDDEKKVLTAAQGTAIATGQASNQAANARAEYQETVARLDKTDSAGRKEARRVITKKTPEPFKSIAKALQEKRGNQTGGTANKSNVAINQRMKIVGTAGKGLLVLGATVSVINVATADNKPRAAVGEVGAWAGALAGGKLGAGAGAAIGAGVGAFFGGVGAVPGTVVGGVVGGLGGGIYGAVKGNEIAIWLYDKLTN